MGGRHWWWMFAFLVLMLAPSWTAAQEAEPRIALQRGPGANGRFAMEFRDAEIKDVLRAIGKERGLNLVVSDEVTGKLTLSFEQVTLGEALDAILKMGNLVKIQDGAITRVIKSPFVDGEGQLLTRMVPIQFANAKELTEPIKGLLSKKGSVTSDPRTNTLIVRDVLESVDRVMEIVKALDSKTPQVMIEARIVEATTNFTRDIGVQWGGRYVTDNGLTTVSGTTLSGGTGSSGAPFSVNLPANVSRGHGGAIGISFGNLTNTAQLDLQLSALEDTGKGRILSTPRILTLDNKEARISSGTEILIPTTTIVTAGAATGGGSAAGQTGVTTIDAKLELSVIPHVTPSGEIVMHVRADKKDPDFSRTVFDIPPLTTRTAETHLLVKNGETIVIGGIFTKSEQIAEARIPWLSQIPVLGWLFKNRETIETQSELLVFITPTIHRAL